MRPTAYRQRILAEVRHVLESKPAVQRALDFGAGDGWFTREIARAGCASAIVPVDVKVWPDAISAPIQFDGVRLPFGDRAFELAYAIDVIHHCADPERALDEVLRCTARYFLIKDHTSRNWLEWCVLGILDELGNRRFGVPSRYRYQERWSWSQIIQERGFVLDTLIHPLRCHSGLLGACTNQLQFLALWRRDKVTEPGTNG